MASDQSWHSSSWSDTSWGRPWGGWNEWGGHHWGHSWDSWSGYDWNEWEKEAEQAHEKASNNEEAHEKKASNGEKAHEKKASTHEADDHDRRAKRVDDILRRGHTVDQLTTEELHLIVGHIDKQKKAEEEKANDEGEPDKPAAETKEERRKRLHARNMRYYRSLDSCSSSKEDIFKLHKYFVEIQGLILIFSLYISSPRCQLPA